MIKHKEEDHKPEHHEHKKETKADNKIYLIIALIVIILFNQYQIYTINKGSVSSSIQGLSDIIPKGIPLVYGAELGISYNDVGVSNPSLADAAIEKMSKFDRSIELQGAELQRYINILYNLEGGISCEYCCGARSVITADGRAACGCAHSYSMRGLTKYLIKNHPTEFTDEQILEELGKWKTLYFPGIMSQKAEILKEKGINLNYINLASNKYRGIEEGETSGGGMVGGC